MSCVCVCVRERERERERERNRERDRGREREREKGNDERERASARARAREGERERESLGGGREWHPGTCVSPKEGKMLTDGRSRERAEHVGGLAFRRKHCRPCLTPADATTSCQRQQVTSPSIEARDNGLRALPSRQEKTDYEPQRPTIDTPTGYESCERLRVGARNLSRAFGARGHPQLINRSSEYGERQCGFDTKHQSTKDSGPASNLRCRYTHMTSCHRYITSLRRYSIRPHS